MDTETDKGNGEKTKLPPITMADVFAMEAPKSDVFRFEYAGREIQAQFKLLSDAEKDRCLLDAAQFITDEKWRRMTKRVVEGKEIHEEWAATTEEALGTVQQAHADRLVIAAACIHPETGVPVATVEHWRQVPDRVLAYLKEKYRAFEQSLDPDQLSEAEIDLCFEVAKKKDLATLLTAFGSRTLASCLIYFVSLWELSMTGESDGFSNGESESLPTPPSPTTP